MRILLHNTNYRVTPAGRISSYKVKGVKQMNDPDIVALYFARSEKALSETESKYGALLKVTARRVLRDERDAEEAASDAVLSAWNSIPPERPEHLGSFLKKLCRNAAIDKARAAMRAKRGGGEYEAALDELAEIPDRHDPAGELVSRLALKEALNRFLASLSPKNRRIFLQRYWYFLTSEEIAEEQLMSPAAVRMRLMRMREELKELLKKEGLYNE